MKDGEYDIRPADAADCAAIVACVRDAYTKYIARMGAEPAPALALSWPRARYDRGFLPSLQLATASAVQTRPWYGGSNGWRRRVAHQG